MNYKKVGTISLGVTYLLSVLVFGLILVVIGQDKASAQLPTTRYDVDSMNKDEYYRDPRDSVTTQACGQTNAQFSNIYMIGDSITEGSEAELTQMFRSNGISSTIDGVSSRSISRGDAPTNGLTVLENSNNSYDEAEAIIVALGTNGGLTESNIADTIEIIRESNENAVLFWVNIGVDNDLRDGENLPAASWNQILNSVSEQYDITVINWGEIVVGGGESLGIIADDGLGVHPNESGRDLFASTIATTILQGGATGACQTQLTGSDNEERAWNFMISKGFQPFQAAGFLGNMKAEAGFEPRLVEYGFPNSRGEISRAGQPSSLDDEIPLLSNERGQPGYGIIQWSGGRKNTLSDFSTREGRPGSDFSLQLDFIWEEMNGPYARVLEAFQASTTVEDATNIILRRYEIPGNIDAAYVVRSGFAREILIRYGSGGGE